MDELTNLEIPYGYLVQIIHSAISDTVCGMVDNTGEYIPNLIDKFIDGGEIKIIGDDTNV